MARPRAQANEVSWLGAPTRWLLAAEFELLVAGLFLVALNVILYAVRHPRVCLPPDATRTWYRIAYRNVLLL